MYEVTMMHGRFQPFHIGHLDYLKLALELTKEHLIIGITNPSPEFTMKEESSSHRHKGTSNPFTYFQRVQMIRESILHDTEINNFINKISFTPLPIHHPEYWHNYFPDNAVHVVCLVEEWSYVKLNRFKENGYKVHAIDVNRITSASNVRTLMSKEESLDQVVPLGTLLTMRSLNLTKNLYSPKAQQIN